MLLIVLSALFASAAAASLSSSSEPPPEDPIYVSSVQLSSVPDNLKPGAKVEIPKGSCSGRINQPDLCGDFLPLAIRVSVSDPMGYAKIDVPDELTHIDIQLKTYEYLLCGKVDIDLQVVCESDEPILQSSPIILSPVPDSN